MKLSTKGRYGVRLMLDLGEHYGKGPVSLKDVAERQEISKKYLWHLVPPLKSVGLIRSIRGSRGGFALARPPKSINLLEIVSCLEDSLCLVDCTENRSACARSERCTMRDIWAEVSAKMHAMLASFTLQSMIERQQDKAGLPNYSI